MTHPLIAIEQPAAPDINEQIRRLGRRRILELPQMLDFHTWLDGKRLARQSCRVVGESRTGKTISCDTYRLKCKASQKPGEPPHIPVLYWPCPENLPVSRLFTGLLELAISGHPRSYSRPARARVSPTRKLPGRDDHLG